jgi:hypothetical protein
MILRFLKSLCVYLLVVLGGTILFIAISPAFDYLSYSDRPGPGHHQKSVPFSFSEFLSGLKFGASYALFMSPYAAVIGTLCILPIRGLEKLKLHRFAVSGIGGVLFFLATGYLALGMGWYIAAGGPLIITTAALGAFAGAVLIPNLRRAHPVGTDNSGAAPLRV